MSEKSPLKIQWTDKTASLIDLVPWERNPREISKKAFKALKDSLRDNGLFRPIVVQNDGVSVIGGHQRIRALQELGIKEVPVKVPHRQLTNDEFRRIAIQDNLSFGEWDFDILGADFKVEELSAWGMQDALIHNIEEINPEPSQDVERLDKTKEHKCPSCGEVFTE